MVEKARGLAGEGVGDGGMNLGDWFSWQVRRHFNEVVRPGLAAAVDHASSCSFHGTNSNTHQHHNHHSHHQSSSTEDSVKRFEAILKLLRSQWDVYVGIAKRWIFVPERRRRVRGVKTPAKHDGEVGDESEVRLAKFIAGLNAVVGYALPEPHWGRVVYDAVMRWCGIVLDVSTGDEDEEDEEEPTQSMINEDTEMRDMDESEDEDTQRDSQMMLSHSHVDPKTHRKAMATKALLSAWASLQTLGLGSPGRRGERIFAEVINVLITRHIQLRYAMRWESAVSSDNRSSAMSEIILWIENDVANLVRKVLVPPPPTSGTNVLRRKERILSPRASFRARELGIDGTGASVSGGRRHGARMSIDGILLGETPFNSLSGRLEMDGAVVHEDDDEGEGVVDLTNALLRKEDIAGWVSMALGRLGRLRVGELFDIVVDWPASLSAIMDLKVCRDSVLPRFILITRRHTQQHRQLASTLAQPSPMPLSLASCTLK